MPTGEDGLTDNPGGTDNFPDASEDISVDFGFVALDYGDLPDGFATLNGTNGPIHVIRPNFYLGSCVDPELNGSPDAEAGTDGTGGDDTANSMFAQGTCSVQ